MKAFLFLALIITKDPLAQIGLSFLKIGFLFVRLMMKIHTNFIDDDGTGESLNIKLFENIRNKINIPIIYSGGISSLDDIKLVKKVGGDGVAIASALHYELLYNMPSKKDKSKYFTRKNITEDIGNYEWLLNGYGNDFSPMVRSLTMKEIKKNITTGRNK